MEGAGYFLPLGQDRVVIRSLSLSLWLLDRKMIISEETMSDKAYIFKCAHPCTCLCLEGSVRVNEKVVGSLGHNYIVSWQNKLFFLLIISMGFIQWWPKLLKHLTDLKIMIFFASKTWLHFKCSWNMQMVVLSTTIYQINIWHVHLLQWLQQHISLA